jgi:hypothetical protein
MMREGSVSIVKYDDERFDVMFSRYDGSAGVMSPCKLTGRKQLRDFLEHKLHINPDPVNEVLDKLQKENTARIPRVLLSDKERFALGLVSPAERLTQSAGN